MSSPEEHKTFNKASRWGHSRAATGRGAARARSKHGRQQEQAPPDMRTSQSAQACLRKVPTDHEAHSRTQRRQPRRVATTGPEQDGDEEPEQPSSGNTDLHAQSREGTRVVLVSPADHAQQAKVRAEEQRATEHAERNTWVSTWTSEPLVETAKPLTKPKPHTAQVM